MNNNEKLISYIQAPITNKSPASDVTLENVFRGIKENETYKEITQEYREILQKDWEDSEKRKMKASSFDYVTFSGTFSYVSSKNLQRHSGLICIDIDKLHGKEDVEEIRTTLLRDSVIDTVMLFVSPSGLGIKWVVPINVVTPSEHLEYFKALNSYIYSKYAIRIDESCKDVSRACFLCHDPDVIYNSKFNALTREFINDWKPPENKINTKSSKVEISGDAPWEDFDRSVDAKDILLQHGYTFFKSDEVGDKLLRPGKDSSSEYSVNIYRDTGLCYVFSDSCRGLESGKTYSPAGLYCALNHGGDWKACAKDMRKQGYGSQKKVTPQIDLSVLPADMIPFWEVDPEDGNCSISSLKYVTYLKERLNIANVDHWGEYILVEHENKIFDRIDNQTLRQKVLGDLEENVAPYDGAQFELVFNAYVSFLKAYSKVIDTIVPKIKPEMLEETKDKAYLYFKNGYLEITKDVKTFHSYNDLDTYIWKDQIIDRNYTPYEGDLNVFAFKDFCYKVSGGKVERYDALRSAFGYLLHSYKDPSNPRAVIMTDEYLGEDLNKSQGGTGKSIACQAVSKMKKTQFIMGKHFDPKNNFAFSSIRPGDKIAFIDDVKSDLNFEDMFNAISLDLAVERKYVNTRTIPYEESPKFLMSTNFPLRGQGNSHDRRQQIIEFAPYFGAEKTVFQEYGHRFYGEWDDESWVKFDAFMVDCIQYYLREGMKEVIINYKTKKLINEVGAEFVEWADSELELGVFYKSKDMIWGVPPTSPLIGYSRIYTDEKLSSKKLKSRLEAWSEARGYDIVKEREGSIRGYVLRKLPETK